MNKFSSQKIIIATHIYATGPALDLKDYLNNHKLEKLLFISHPLFYSTHLKGSGFQFFKQGRLVTEFFKQHNKIPDVLTYFIHPILTLWFIMTTSGKWNIFIGSDNLNAICGVFLKIIGKVDKTVYYVIDYNPKRFPNKILNSIYHYLDQICVRFSDETWNLSPRMEQARKDYFGFSGGRQKVVYLGIWYSRIHALAIKHEYDPYVLVYIGQVAKKQGIQHVLDAIPSIVKKLPKFKFLVMGGGDYLETLRQHAASLKIDKFVEFTGFIDDHKTIENKLTKCALSVAMYEKYVDGALSFTYFTDPGKVKLYLSAGLPVLISDVPYNAQEIVKRKCGLIIDEKPESISHAVTEIMSNPKKLAEYKSNAIKMSEDFDWEKIFTTALSSLIPETGGI